MRTKAIAYAIVFCLFTTYQTQGQISIRPPVREFTADGGGGYILTSGTGSWTAKTTADWISIQPRTSGEADESCIYVVRKNNHSEPRDGQIIINDIAHTVIQYGGIHQVAPVVSFKESAQVISPAPAKSEKHTLAPNYTEPTPYLSVFAEQTRSSIGIMGVFHNSSDYNEGYGAALRYTFDLEPDQQSLRLAIQGSYLTGYTDSWTEESMYRSDDISYNSIELMAMYDFLLNPSTTLYLGVGGGLYIPSVDVAITVSPGGLNWLDYFNADVDTDADSTAGYLALVGIEQAITDNISLFLEIRYLSLKFDVDLTTTSSAAGGGMSFSKTVKNTNEYDMSGIGGYLGVIWRF